MSTDHTWDQQVIPSTSFATVSAPVAATQETIPVDNREFVVWDPYTSSPVSTIWDGGATTWIE